jgi:hypothetical protein
LLIVLSSLSKINLSETPDPSPIKYTTPLRSLLHDKACALTSYLFLSLLNAIAE